jgi:hypothetical protein
MALSGTVPVDYPADIANLTTIPFPTNSIIRGSPDDFAQREIRTKLTVCNSGDFAKNGISEVVKFLMADNTGSVVLFVNSRHASYNILNQLEKKLNEKRCRADGLVVNGAQKNTDKFLRTRIFCEEEDAIDDVHMRWFIATNAVNVGINKVSIRFVVRYEMARDLCTQFQEQGRGSRRPGDPSIFHLYIDMQSFVFLRSQAMGNERKVSSGGAFATAAVGIGTAITPLAKRGTNSTSGPSTKSYKLSPREARLAKKRATKELAEVVRFNCLKLGAQCQHKRKELYLSTGVLDPELGGDDDGVFDCKGQCPICSGEWDKLFMPVYKKSLYSFFQSAVISNGLPLVTTRKKTISNLLWGNKYWIKKIFDRGFHSVKKSHVDALFLSLVGCGIVDLESISGEIRWNLCREKTTGNAYNDCPVYQRDSAWVGLNMHDPERSRRNDPDNEPDIRNECANRIQIWYRRIRQQ